MTLYEAAFYFIIYAILGWMSEVIFSTCKKGTFINRGFLNGPVCPIYGCGAVLILFLLQKVMDNYFLVFILSVLITTAIEFLTGLFLELIFHNKWWDYSNRRFNIKGYVCLLFSILWGVACLFVVAVIHPGVSFIVKSIPKQVGIWILVVVYIMLIVDTVNSVIQITKFNRSLGKLEIVSKELHVLSEAMGSGISNATMAMKEKYDVAASKYGEIKEEIVEKYEAVKRKYDEIINSSHVKSIVKRFPTLKSRKHQKEVEDIKNHK